MARCDLCGKKIGMFQGRSRSRGRTLCRQCVHRGSDREKRETLARLCADGEPTAAFTIPAVQTRCPDAPRQLTLIGDLAFTDKGLCFVQIAEVRKADGSAGLLFGIVGAAVAESTARRKTRDDYAHARQLVVEDAASLVDVIQRVPRLIYVPASDITAMGHGWCSHFQVKTRTGRHMFKLERGSKTYKQWRPQIEAYLDAIAGNINANPYAQAPPLPRK